MEDNPFSAEVSRQITRRALQFLGRHHHEAGHAVAAYLFHVKLVSASIKHDETGVGRCLLDLHRGEWIDSIETVPATFEGQWFDDWRALLRRDYFERVAIVALAGQVAELRHGGLDSVADASEDVGWGSDDQIVLDCLKWMAEDWDDVDKRREWLKARAARLIEANWAFVEAVAGDLREHEEMVWDDMDKIYKALTRASRLSPRV